MKILFFNLGTVESRIYNWGIDGFKSIFEQDVILWGPIPEKEFVYNNKEIPIISVFEETSIKTIFERLPDKWFPDIVTCDTSVINYVPDIYLCPVKTVLFTRDAWADTIFNRELVELFDFIDYGIIDHSNYHKFSVNILPLSNCAVTLPDSNPDLPEFEKREIDVISISNYTESFYHERHKAFYKVSDSNSKGLNIKYISGIARNELNKWYQRSKIVIDWSYTLSNRSYEAALNRCLLFSHEKNNILKEFWIPWEEYVPYNENNAIELLEYYITNPDQAKRIIDKAHEKVKRIPSSMGQAYWNQIKIAFDTTINIQDRIDRSIKLPKGNLLYRLATSFTYNYNYKTNFPADWQKLYFNRINTAITDSLDTISKIPPLIQASRMAFLLKETGLSENYLSVLEQIMPEYAWIYYLRGRIYYEQNNMSQALVNTEKAIDCAKRAPDLLQKYILPVIEWNNNCDNRRITDYLWQPVCGHSNEFQVKSLYHLSYELMGDIYQINGKTNNAIDSYSEAVLYIPIPRCLCKLSRLLIESGNYKKLADIIEKGREDSPYENCIVFYFAYALCRINQKRKALILLKEHRRALTSFFGKRSIEFTKHAIRIIMLLKPFGKKIISKALIMVIKVYESEKQTNL